MCHFISWIENGSELQFLTANDVFNTKRGRELQKHCRHDADVVGHGAIEFFTETSGGVHKECTDFSTPKNFPEVIVAAIKAGAFAGLGTPKGLLNKKAQAKYDKVCDAAWAECEKVREAALVECEKVRGAALAECEKVREAASAEYYKVCKAAWAECDKVCSAAQSEYIKVRNAAWVEYEKVRDAALAEYDKVCGAALVEYDKVRGETFWKLFADVKNRAKAWK